MANSTLNKEWLERNSLRVYDGMIAVHPITGEYLLYNQETASKFNGCYASNNSTICFVSDFNVFVTPYTRDVMTALNNAGFHNSNFFVPFSNADYPKFEQATWKSLKEKALLTYAKDFATDCENYCDERHIGSLSSETLQNCFQMPSTGVMVKHHYFVDYYYPVLNSKILDCTAVKYLGHFCTNNGKVVFVYRDGKTYVTKGYKILSELRAAGYTETGMFVPFSNGEEILDPLLKELWENITK